LCCHAAYIIAYIYGGSCGSHPTCSILQRTCICTHVLILFLSSTKHNDVNTSHAD
jgi:hypothetical protein